MKNVLLYNYNLNLDSISSEDNGNFSFYIDYEKFYFTICDRPEEDLKEILDITRTLKTNYHKIIPNNMGSIYTPYKGKNYVLIKINGPENNEIDILDLIREDLPYIGSNTSLLRTDWGNLWSAKVDYLEYQMSELGMTHKVARHSFSYYVGLAENAIEYFNLLKPDDLTTVISHKRIKSPFRSKNYYDPLDMIIDYRSRDYASYLKMKFFEGEDVLREVRLLVDKNILNPLEYNLLFARLLYPSYYFDDLRRVLEAGEEDDILLKYIDKVDDYEAFLAQTYNIIKEKSSMLKIDWLIKTS